MATEKLPHVGDRIELKFALPGSGRRMSIQSEVRWVREAIQVRRERPSGMGLRFLQQSADDVFALGEFLVRREALMGEIV